MKTNQGKIEIQVNGEAKVFEEGQMSMRDLLAALGLDPEQTGIAVALNLSVVPRGEWSQVEVRHGDEVDVITARQGG